MNPPPKETMLQLAEYYSEFKAKRFHELSWIYLFCWAFYDHWVEDWINAKDI
jgi:hypothetical protein